MHMHISDLAQHNNVLLFQEVNAAWRARIEELLEPLGLQRMKGDFHEDGLVIFHDSSVVALAVETPFVWARRSDLAATKAWRRITIASLQHRAMNGVWNKYVVGNVHCISGQKQNNRNIPGDAEKARRFKMDFLRLSFEHAKAFAVSQGCSTAVILGDTNLETLTHPEMRFPVGTSYCGKFRDFAVASKDSIVTSAQRFIAWDQQHKSLEITVAPPTATAEPRSQPPQLRLEPRAEPDSAALSGIASAQQVLTPDEPAASSDAPAARSDGPAPSQEPPPRLRELVLLEFGPARPRTCDASMPDVSVEPAPAASRGAEQDHAEEMFQQQVQTEKSIEEQTTAESAVDTGREESDAKRRKADATADESDSSGTPSKASTISKCTTDSGARGAGGAGGATSPPPAAPRRDSPFGMTLNRVRKRGAISYVSEEVGREAFMRLYEIRRKVQEKRGLDWAEFFNMDAQRECQTALRDQHDKNLPRERADCNRKAKDSWYHVWCYHQYGGQGWVKVFFAFGMTDARMVEIFNEEWKLKLRSFGVEPSEQPCPNPRLSARSLAALANEELPPVAGPRTHRSERKLIQADCKQIRAEIKAFQNALAESQSNKGYGGKVYGGKGVGKSKGGKGKFAQGVLHRSGSWLWRGTRWTMEELQDHLKDCLCSN